MKRLSPQELSLKLSQYVDGELSAEEARQLEDYLAAHPEASQELRELQALKQHLHNRNKLPAAIGFWTRLSAKLDTVKDEEQNLLPFPRRFLPVATALGVLSMVAVGVILFQQRQPIMDFVSQKTEEVHQMYEGSFLRGAIVPLLSDIDRDQVLQFALFGTLSLDEKSETSLRVDETAEKGYRIEVGKAAKRKTTEKAVPALTVKEFYEEIKPTPNQVKTIDSLLRLAQKHLEASVLVAENQAMAIAPDLPEVGRVTVSSIAACLEPHQRARFERFLQLRNAPYAVIPSNFKAKKAEEIFPKLQKSSRPDRFVILTPETLVVHQLEINIDSLREEVHRSMKQFKKVQFNFEQFAQRIRGRNLHDGIVVVGTQPMRVLRNQGSFRIEYETNDTEVPEASEIHRFVKPRFPKPNVLFFGEDAPFDLEVFMNDSLIPFDEKMDSMQQYFRRGRVTSYGPKLDSLMRRIERAYADSLRARKIREWQQREDE
jgi:hypothetical protein